MKSVLLGLMIYLSVTVFPQNKEDDESNVRVDPKKPIVYLSYVCQDEKKIYLRMYKTQFGILIFGQRNHTSQLRNQFC